MVSFAAVCLALPLGGAALDCHAVSADVTDAYCNKMCNWTPPYCPADKCQCGSPTPSPSPTPPSPVPSPPPSPTPAVVYPDLTQGIGTAGTYFDGSSGKCGGYQSRGMDSMVAFPLAYWGKKDIGNCDACGVACGSGGAMLHGKPLCYRLTNAQGQSETAAVVESCGGNCALAGRSSCLISPDCAADPDGFNPTHRCAPAQVCGGLASNLSAPVSLNGTGHRPIPCTLPPFADSPDPGFVDWCSGHWVHFDTVGRRSSLCPSTAMGGSGVCPVKYEQIDCGGLEHNDVSV